MAAKKKKKVSSEKKFDDSSLEALRNSVLDYGHKLLQERIKGSSFYRLDDPNVPTRIKRVIPTGLPSFDLICTRTPMGRCGLAIGRQVEIYGENSAGKTSLACALGAAAQQRLGWLVHWLEHENKFDPDRAETIGLDSSKVEFGQPNCLEDTIDSIDTIMDSIPERKDLPDKYKTFGSLVIVDSVAAMPSRTELEGDMDDNNIGVFQRKMSQAMRRITNRLSKRNMTILWINQTRDKLGFGSKGGKTTYGGNALKFYCALRWQLWAQRNGEKGILIHLKNTKNQTGVRPFLETEVYLNFKDGFDYVDSWSQALQQLFIAEREGNSIKFLTGEKEGSKFSMNKLRDMYSENPQFFFDYEKIIKDHIEDYHVLEKKKKDEEATE